MSDLKDRLHPTHLPNLSVEEIHEAAQERLAPPEPDKGGPDNDPRAKSVYTFSIRYVTARGEVYSGQFTTRIPTIADRDMIGVIAAGMKAGYPADSFSALSQELHLIQAHLQVCLEDKPEWARNLKEIHDFQLLHKIFEEVRSHEAYFLGWSTDAGESA